MARPSAKIRQPSKRAKKGKLPLDTVLKKRGRGRPARVRPSAVRGRGDNYRWILNQVWDRLWPQLSKAQSKADVINALQEGASPYDREFIPIAELVPQVLHDTKFKEASGADQLCSGFIGRTWLDKSAALPRYLRGGASERKARPSYYSVRSLCRMLLWLQRPIPESRLS